MNRYIAGLHLGNETSDLTYCFAGGEPETISTVTGEEEYSIPTALAKLQGGEYWAYGAEALRAAQEGEGILVDDLLRKALDGEPLFLEEKRYEAVNLLTLYLSRLLGLLAPLGGSDRMDALLITVPNLDRHGAEILQTATAGLRLGTKRIFFQGAAESFYNYMLHQEESLWRHGAILMEIEGEELRVLRMETNRKATPVVVHIGEESYPFPMQPRTNAPDEEYEIHQHDKMLLHLAQEICAGAPVSCICLVGERISGDWAGESIRFLCTKARVFRGNNLYSKGACYGLRDRLEESEEAGRHIFLGKEKLSANIGMRLLRQGEEVYFALLDAGTDWYEASETFDFYLQDGNSFDLQVSSLVGAGNRTVRVTLEDFPEHITRLRIHLYLQDARTLAVHVEELGFGEIFPCEGREWTEAVEL